MKFKFRTLVGWMHTKRNVMIEAMRHLWTEAGAMETDESETRERPIGMGVVTGMVRDAHSGYGGGEHWAFLQGQTGWGRLVGRKCPPRLNGAISVALPSSAGILFCDRVVGMDFGRRIQPCGERFVPRICYTNPFAVPRNAGIPFSEAALRR
jgi:hypothetical protein